jgi:hypothetical protein
MNRSNVDLAFSGANLYDRGPCENRHPNARPSESTRKVENLVEQDMSYREPSLLKGFFLCIWDSEAVRLQTSQWKRNLLFFLSGVCLEVAAAPYLAGWMGFEPTVPIWLLTVLFFPLGLLGCYASKFGTDRLVEWLLILSA